MMKRNWQRFTSDISILLYIATVTVVCHFIVSGNYGYFGDELYTLACSRNLSLAFVDIPPVAPALLALNTALFGDSLTAIHILPSLFCGAMVLLVGLMAKELGGGKKAAVFAGLCAALVPVWMTLGTLYTYDFLDQFMVTLLFYMFIRLLKRENPKTWLAIGAIVGVGVMVKPSMLFFAAGCAIALLLTKQRRQYLTRWPWLGAALAFAIILPALVWQVLNHFPLVEYWLGYTKEQTLETGHLDFILMQVFSMDIVLLPVWALGLYYFLFHKEGRKYRLLGVFFCVLFVLFLFMNVKMYMPIPLYAMLLAGGSVMLEKLIGARKRGKLLLPAYACILVAAAVIQAPLMMPILPENQVLGYMDTVGGAFGFTSVQVVKDNSAGVPLYFTARFDWDVLADDVAAVYDSLPAAERENATIAADEYTFAGAVDLFGGKLGLPKAVCGRFNYYYFSVDNIKNGTWIAVGMPLYILEENFGDVSLAKESLSKFRQPWKIDIYICRDPKSTADEMKKELRSVQ